MMTTLRICQAVSLNPRANGPEPVLPSSSRICLMGCQDVKPNELRRFPVHDTDRCNHWLRHFGVSYKLVDQLGGLQKLRICSRHFSQRQEMAKTRIKMTPLRKSSSSKGTVLPINGAGGSVIAGVGGGGKVGGGGVNGGGGAGTGSGAVKSALAGSTTIELVESPHRHQAKKPHTNVMPMPQRSHSISSSASSDVQSINSDYEASLPLSALEDSQNGLNRLENGQAKKRKLYVITEKSDETKGQTLETNGQAKKRKMFVVVEQDKDVAGKKLMIMADKPQANLTQHLEKLLPELLNRIQDKEQKQIKPTPVVAKAKPVVNNPRPHITLPPKKNPTNFVKIPSTPSSVPSSIQMPLPIQNAKIPKSEHSEVTMNSEEIETNINLSPDFRFLMKILPKLEQLPEPHKQNVKRSIQIFVEKSYSIYGNKD
ncbi:uncharacterized protein LOC6533386 isoform X1 [Drosophila yakuba]|uniref:Uncharacterized protein, isoform A n=2 Tax=Drosophila yakuba TaxID=7245 RepID=B4PCD7_DROYA|nr:uncharacterized protein LOC6533386 isoform X1 [Drosophila yakuba]EDW93822.1 uncharacterized protein Dyak_GE20378, isoform A [Drosophila yakuba]